MPCLLPALLPLSFFLLSVCWEGQGCLLPVNGNESGVIPSAFTLWKEPGDLNWLPVKEGHQVQLAATSWAVLTPTGGVRFVG